MNENETSDTTKQQPDSNEDSSILKNEINSLNQEIKSLMKRIKTLEEGLFYFDRINCQIINNDKFSKIKLKRSSKKS